jgi:Uma2 family endonuclease
MSSNEARAAKLMTLVQWAHLDEDVPGELVDGVLEDEEMPTHRHELAVTFLVLLLAAWARTRGGRVTGSETKIAIGPRRGRKPDVAMFVPPELPNPDDAVARVKPYLVVEVVSPRPRDARRDRVDKLRDYAAAGARYYWLVDPQVRTFEVLKLGARRIYSVAGSFTEGTVRTVPGCAGLRLDLDALWAEADGKPTTRGRARRGSSRAS